MTPGTSTLERRIATALGERADSLPPASVRELDGGRTRRTRPRWPAALVAAVVVAALVIAVAATRPFADGGRRPATATTTAPSVSSTTTTLVPAPGGVLGPEVPLSPADTADTQFLIRMQKRNTPNATPFAVQIPNDAPIVVNGACMTIAVAPPDGTGYQGSCSVNPATRIVGTVDTGGNINPTSVVYGAWVGVPADATYVTLTYGDEHSWQRPLQGVSYFTRVGVDPPLGGEPLILRAYNDAGQQLGEAARATPIRLGDGSWSWM